MTDFLLQYDQYLFFFLHPRSSSSWLDPLMMGVSSWALWASLSAIAFMFAALRKDTYFLRILVLASLALLLADSVSYFILKPFFSRLRPCKEFPDLVRAISGCAGFYGFPSNHACNSGAVAMVFAGSYKRWVGFLFFGLALLICYSRIYLGAHYPLDVAAGLLLGVTVGSFVWSRKIK